MDTQRIFGKAFKKPASKRSKAEKKYAGRTTKRRVALLDGIDFDWDIRRRPGRSCSQLEVFKEESRATSLL